MDLIFLYSRRRSIWDHKKSQKLNEYCWSLSYVGSSIFFFLVVLVVVLLAHADIAGCRPRRRRPPPPAFTIMILAYFFFLVRSMRNAMKKYELFANFQDRSIPCA